MILYDMILYNIILYNSMSVLYYIVLCYVILYYIILYYILHITYGNRQNYGKKNVQLRQAAPVSDFSIIGFFPIRVQNIPEVIRTFFSP